MYLKRHCGVDQNCFAHFSHHMCRPPLRHTIRRLSRAVEKPRINPLGIQYLSEQLHRKVFPRTLTSAYKLPADEALVQLAKDHLKQNGLLGKKTTITDPITIANFPDLVGESTLDEHFHRIGLKSAHPYLSMAEKFLSGTVELPPRPQQHEWLFQPGWTKYEKGAEPRAVPYPEEDEIVFDVETMYKLTNYLCMATAVSEKAWYGWVSPFLTNFAKDPSYTDHNHLIPLNVLNQPKLVIGHNISYDRARVLEEYNIKQSKGFYLDTMALHIATNGICSRQRPAWMKHTKSVEKLATQSDEEDIERVSVEDVATALLEDPWLNKGSPNSLATVARFHCGITLDKDIRDLFSTENPQEIVDNFPTLMDYCAGDVDATFQTAVKLFPQFRTKVPHPVSFAALRHLGTLVLPTTKKWDSYLEAAENTYEENRKEVTTILFKLVDNLVKHVDANEPAPDHTGDPWFSQLDWTVKEKRLKKDGTPAARQAYMVGYPEWYRDLFKSSDRQIRLSVRTRITPLLLRLRWEGYPLYWTDSCGWCFKVPYDEKAIAELTAKNYSQAKLSEEDIELHYPRLRDDGNFYELFQVPHPDGKGRRCTSVLSNAYLLYFEKGILTSEFEYALEILKLNTQAAYWVGNRARISEQFVVYEDPKNSFFPTKKSAKEHADMGIIIPRICTMGTVTRRATENTWLTASNAKKNRIGSELKAMIEAPEGYALVGADVDSEELWIAALVGDLRFGIHGATALGWMTLEGDKNEKTDLHSRTAEILGISRNDAKVFNYGRIYGAGVKFATSLLKQCNPALSDDEAAEIATNLYKNTKGDVEVTNVFGKFYHGGIESVMFNGLESVADQPDPRTPVLGALITDALAAPNLNKNRYLPSRVNWTIQSSGVDYLHLLVVSMDYLIAKYKVDARLMITVHDEVRYLVKKEERYKLALLLQVSNLWTRAMFCEQLGINELPQSVAFFSEVDIDHVLRKEVTADCVTPSHPEAIPPGESLNIHQLLEKISSKDLDDPNLRGAKLTKFKYTPRTRVLEALHSGTDADKLLQLRMQTAPTKKLLKAAMKSRATGPREPPKLSRQWKDRYKEVELKVEGDEALQEEMQALQSQGLLKADPKTPRRAAARPSGMPSENLKKREPTKAVVPTKTPKRASGDTKTSATNATKYKVSTKATKASLISPKSLSTKVTKASMKSPKSPSTTATKSKAPSKAATKTVKNAKEPEVVSKAGTATKKATPSTAAKVSKTKAAKVVAPAKGVPKAASAATAPAKTGTKAATDSSSTPPRKTRGNAAPATSPPKKPASGVSATAKKLVVDKDPRRESQPSRVFTPIGWSTQPPTNVKRKDPLKTSVRASSSTPQPPTEIRHATNASASQSAGKSAGAPRRPTWTSTVGGGAFGVMAIRRDSSGQRPWATASSLAIEPRRMVSGTRMAGARLPTPTAPRRGNTAEGPVQPRNGADSVVAERTAPNDPKGLRGTTVGRRRG